MEFVKDLIDFQNRIQPMWRTWFGAIPGHLQLVSVILAQVPVVVQGGLSKLVGEVLEIGAGIADVWSRLRLCGPVLDKPLIGGEQDHSNDQHSDNEEWLAHGLTSLRIGCPETGNK